MNSIWKTGKDVGASKAAKHILESLDRRLIEPGRIVVRFSGWVLWFSILYLYVFEVFSQARLPNIRVWLLLYAAYLILLEIFRRIWNKAYDKTGFRLFRILFNLAVISVLVSIASPVHFLAAFAYTVPILAAIVYFGEYTWVKISVFLLALSGLYVGGVLLPDTPLSSIRFLVLAIPLGIFSLAFELVRRRINLAPGRLTELAKELHKTLDLQQLMSEILEHAVDITQAERGLIIIINPRNKRYIGHLFQNLSLRADRSVEELAKKCFVLVNGQPFECPDMIAAFNNQSIYDEFFEFQPQAVLAEPLFSRSGQIMGVINVAYDESNSFDQISINQLKEFAFLISNAIENCLEYREMKLREAKSREVGGKFVSSTTEDEVVHTLIEEVRQQIPHAEKLTLHRYFPKNKSLVSIYSFSYDTTPKFFIWSNQYTTQRKPKLNFGYGIAGHALELREIISVPNVQDHPWYINFEGPLEAKSLVVAPLFDPEDNDLYGTLSLESSRLYAFNLDDESILTNLSTQASLAIAKIRDFQGWKEEGGVLRRMLEQIRSFDTSGTEEMICQQVADAATSLLGFKIARILMIAGDDKLITTAISGLSAKNKGGLIGKSLNYSDLASYLQPVYKVGNSYLIKHGTSGWKETAGQHFYRPPESVHPKSGWDAYAALLTPLVDPSGNIIGIMSLDVSDLDSEPNKQALELIGVFADAAGWVIELGRFQKRITDQQNRTQSFIDSISHELAQGRDIETICEVVVQVGAKLFNAEGCSLHFVTGNQVVLKHSNYLAQTDFLLRHKPISMLPKSGLTAWVAATGKVLRYNHEEYKNHEAWAGETNHLQYLPSKYCQSVLIAPVKDKDSKVIAVLSLENKRNNTGTGLKDFDKKDEDRLIRLTIEFSKALETIGLYEDIKDWERTGLAEDLHDLLNWYHSGVILWIDAIEEWLKKGDLDKMEKLLPELRKHAYTTIYEMKALHSNVLSKSLEASTFKQALSNTLSAWSSRAIPKYEGKMDIKLECPEDLEVPVKIRNTIIRIASLAFSNAIRHSGITENPNVRVLVKVEQNQKGITLAIIDNGIGIDYEKNPPGFGMDRMQQLSQKINTWGEMSSDLRIQTAINQGTEIFLCLEAKG